MKKTLRILSEKVASDDLIGWVGDEVGQLQLGERLRGHVELGHGVGEERHEVDALLQPEGRLDLGEDVVGGQPDLFREVGPLLGLDRIRGRGLGSDVLAELPAKEKKEISYEMTLTLKTQIFGSDRKVLLTLDLS